MKKVLVEAARWVGALLLCIVGFVVLGLTGWGFDWLMTALAPWFPVLILLVFVGAGTAIVRYGVFK